MSASTATQMDLNMPDYKSPSAVKPGKTNLDVVQN